VKHLNIAKGYYYTGDDWC